MPPIRSAILASMAATAVKSRGRLRWWLHGPTSPLLDAFTEDPDGILHGPASVARDRVGRKRFFRVAPEPEGPALYVKVFTVPPGWARLRSIVRPSKARREARVAAGVEARGFEVAAPVAVGEERRRGRLLRSFSVVPERPGRDLRALLADPATRRQDRRALALAFGAFARRLHDAGIDQDDFSPNNFLVDSGGTFALLDFERCRVGRPLGSRRWKLLAKLHRHDLGVRRTDRLRFLDAYLGGSTRKERRTAWERIEREFWRIRRRDARRAAHAAFRVGRHVGRAGAAWFVRGREGRPVRRLELGGRAARRGWIRAHQLERLALPALRPVRLEGGGLELEEPASASVDRKAAIARALRAFSRYGTFVKDPEWAFADEGALLADPSAFRLSL